MDEKEEVKETHIQIRVSFEEKRIIERWAEKAGMNISEWIRTRAMSDLSYVFFQEGEE